mmetsp:Transcript_44666/g.51542  ORF Transcript_44666/g.51542 Transcript_44666/m.51542 type:complete len:88 (+) Transcript_44666:261-524(+)
MQNFDTIRVEENHDMNMEMETRRKDEIVTDTKEGGLVYHKINKQKHKKRKVKITDTQMMMHDVTFYRRMDGMKHESCNNNTYRYIHH